MSAKNSVPEDYVSSCVGFILSFFTRSESSGGGAPLLSAEGAARRADYQPRGAHEKGELLLFLCVKKKPLTVILCRTQTR